MEFLSNPLVITIFLPLVGIVLILFFKEAQGKVIRWAALLTSLATFGVSLWVLGVYLSRGAGTLKLVQPWFHLTQDISVNLHLEVDGISLLMILLTTLLTPIAILSTWKSVTERVKGFMIFFLLLEVGMNGVFLAFDLVLFFIFWEFTLIPMYFLIGIWGGERRIYAAIKFFIFTMAGSVLMLVAIFYLGVTAGTFSLPDLVAARQTFFDAQMWLFLAFGIAFAIKVPMFPLHTWLPDAHVEAPTAGSVILAGVLLKMGAYGFLRFNLPLFPEASLSFAPFMCILAIIGILYGAMVAFAQKDVKKLVAYSSVSHLGFVMLGIFSFTPLGISGAVLQMVNHGLSTGALFLIVGMLYERRHTRDLAAFGGIWKVMPVFGALSLIVTLSSMGLPGLNGFVGEFTILQGTFTSTVLGTPWYALVAALGVILAAVYLLWMFEKVFLGAIRHEENAQLKDINLREVIILLPLVVLIFWIGLYPQTFFNLIEPAANSLTGVFLPVPIP
jgi:NADH-quinone oxidoreductase subunit M